VKPSLLEVGDSFRQELGFVDVGERPGSLSVHRCCVLNLDVIAHAIVSLVT
jgi:hypothetical protein